MKNVRLFPNRVSPRSLRLRFPSGKVEPALDIEMSIYGLLLFYTTALLLIGYIAGRTDFLTDFSTWSWLGIGIWTFSFTMTLFIIWFLRVTYAVEHLWRVSKWRFSSSYEINQAIEEYEIPNRVYNSYRYVFTEADYTKVMLRS